MRIAFYGSSLVSAYWNGAATYYRGLLKALARRGYRIAFFEPDAYDRQRHRDIPDPDWAEVTVYPATESGLSQALDAGRGADVLIKASGVGVFDAALAAAIPALRRPDALALYWDVDAPATLEALAADPGDPLHRLVPCYDAVLTYGGGPPVVEAYGAAGARLCVPVYNALDPETHHPVPPDPAAAVDLLFVGNRLPDREARVEAFFLAAAAAAPECRFALGGSGWDDKPVPGNVTRLGHVFTADHNRLNSSARAVLNINRASMARFGFSPPTRVFEAAGAGACVITDDWPGIAQFLEPGREILVARDGGQVADHVRGLDAERARRIGQAARRRLLAEHTYDHRAAQVDALLRGGAIRPAVAAQ